MAANGFETAWISKLCMTSAISEGAVDDSEIFTRSRFCGKIKLADTATSEAISVLARYRTTTLPKRRSRLDFPEASEHTIKTNTNTGATALSAFTNRIPNSPIHFCDGIRKPKTAPTTMAMAIRRTRLTLLYFFTAALNFIYTSKPLYYCSR